MDSIDTAFQYQQTIAGGASPVGQVVALYDRILRDFRQAALALEAGQVEKRVSALNHAQTIIGELQGVLDFERGGEAAKRLDGFYSVARALLMKAGVENSGETLQELMSMFARLRSAWAQVEHMVTGGEPTHRLHVSSPTRANFPQHTASALENATGSGSGGWRA